MDIEKHLVATIPPKQVQVFTDPYVYNEASELTDDNMTDPLAQASVEKT